MMDDKRTLKTIAYAGLIFIIYWFYLSDYLRCKNFSIKPSLLPQNELWTIRQAQSIEDKVTPYGYHQIEDGAALLALIKQAYQWDKNAMIVYADYIDYIDYLDNKDDTRDNFNSFLKDHEDQIVDKNGNRLKRPDIFDNTQLLYKKLADAGYPQAALKEAVSIYPKGDLTSISPEERKKKISYLHSALTGGYHSAHVLLADTIMISAGVDCNGPEFNRLNPLNREKNDLSQADIQQALNEYKIDALHGSSYGMFRLAEAYYNGIGVKKSDEEAYVWGRMAIFAFDEYQQRKDSIFLRDKTYIRFREQVINHATEKLLKEIQNELTEPHDLNNVVNEYFHEMITWDYYQWKNDIEPVPPRP
ncbi:sel1 repeat family protein [Salmonella enterica]|nr:sel1 repeat family protein [Salmonella enterica]EIX6435655.1 sel1 repeat family protein [Salmonella enterica]EJH7016062.1 sel1 repeat family protein [Salmonella enterica]EJH7441505.1 sel1 repeat family protein [Salmonella enterica]EJH7880906.1 sel1 repeat family protein [Salmonella enterica]